MFNKCISINLDVTVKTESVILSIINRIKHEVQFSPKQLKTCT